MASRMNTDFDEVVTVDVDSEGVSLSIVHGVQSTEIVLRPSQAERLAAELLAYANGDHLLPPDAVRPTRIVEETKWPDHWDPDECRCASGMHTCGRPNDEVTP